MLCSWHFHSKQATYIFQRGRTHTHTQKERAAYIEIGRTKLYESYIGMWIVMPCRCAVWTRLTASWWLCCCTRQSHQQAACNAWQWHVLVTQKRLPSLAVGKPRSAVCHFSVTMSSSTYILAYNNATKTFFGHWSNRRSVKINAHSEKFSPHEQC